MQQDTKKNEAHNEEQSVLAIIEAFVTYFEAVDEMLDTDKGE